MTRGLARLGFLAVGSNNPMGPLEKLCVERSKKKSELVSKKSALNLEVSLWAILCGGWN